MTVGNFLDDNLERTPDVLGSLDRGQIQLDQPLTAWNIQPVQT